MLSVVSVRGGAWPQQPLPVTRPLVVSAIKPSAALGSGSAQAVGASAEPALESAWLARPVSVSTLPPVDPAQQSERFDMLRDAAAPEKSGVLPSDPAAVRDEAALLPQKAKPHNASEAAYPGQLPKPYQTPQEKAEQERIDNFLSNVWQASRTVVDTWQSMAPAAQQATHEASASRRTEDAADSSEFVDATDTQSADATTSNRSPVAERKAILPALLAGASDKPTPLTDLGAAAHDAAVRTATESYTQTQRWPVVEPPPPGTGFSTAI